MEMDDGRVIMKGPSPAAPPETPESSRRDVAPDSPTNLNVATSADTSVTKVNARYSPRGKGGQRYLAAGVKLSMRLWEDEQPATKSPTQRDYETIGYVIQGRAELSLEGQTITLTPGDSWVVPKGATHCYKIIEPFTAVEATCPPAEVHGRDEQ